MAFGVEAVASVKKTLAELAKGEALGG